MKMRFSLPLLMLLAGCSATGLLPDATEQQQQVDEHQIASQILKKCQSSTNKDGKQQNCEQIEDGTIPINHPVDEVDMTLAAKADDADSGAEEPEVVEDLWQRIRDELRFPIPNNQRVANQRNWYKAHPEYMQRVTKRASPFLYLIVKEIEKRHMPVELALLPIVESAYDPFAYSYGRAAGMWQFVPATGKRFGLKQGWWYDGRRDVVAATNGALDYFTYLLKMFHGNWLHALAAYNSGEGRVLHAIRYNKKHGKPTDFWSLDLPKETRAYVPKLLALADMLRNHDDDDKYWYPIANSPVTQVVDVGSQIDLALAADMADLTVQELHALNPGYNRWATDPEGPHKLLLPIDSVDTFTAALKKTSDKQRLNWKRHKVKNGDSLNKLAKEFHTTANIIRKVNHLNGNMIVVGDYLLIPVALKSLDFYTLSKDQRLATTQHRRHGAYKFTHRVVSGDTFWDLSRKYHVNLRRLAKWNSMAPTDPLRPGQNLVIWKNRVSSKQTADSIMRKLTYTVRSGDSLDRIAHKFKVLIADIARWNQINIHHYLQPGQKLKIFVDVTRT